jgi:hypothetical protein
MHTPTRKCAERTAQSPARWIATCRLAAGRCRFQVSPLPRRDLRPLSTPTSTSTSNNTPKPNTGLFRILYFLNNTYTYHHKKSPTAHEHAFIALSFLSRTPFLISHQTNGIPQKTHATPTKEWNQPLPMVCMSGSVAAVIPAPSKHRIRLTVAPAAAGEDGWMSMIRVVPIWQMEEAQMPKTISLM